MQGTIPVWPLFIEFEPCMVRVVENEGRVLGEEVGELKNLKE